MDHEVNPLVSIIVPTFNNEDYIQGCLESIDSQTYQNIEVIVVNDGSNDATEEIAAAYVRNHDRFLLQSHEHQGAGVARNTGMSKANGEYLLFFDGDDIMEVQMVEALVSRALETEADIVSCRSMSFDDHSGAELPNDNGPYTDDFQAVRSGADFGKRLFFSFVGWPWDKLFRSSYIYKLNLTFQPLSSTNDAYFVFTALALAERISIVDRKLARHRVHDNSVEATSHNTPHNVNKAYRAIYNRLQLEKANESLLHSCISWGLGHMRWAFLRFDGDIEAQTAVVGDYLALLSEADAINGYEFDSPEEIAAAEYVSLTRKLPLELAGIAESFKLGKANQDNYWLQQRANDYEATIEDLHERITSLNTEINSLHAFIDELESSTSYRVGRAITAIPRTIKDSRNKPPTKPEA